MRDRLKTLGGWWRLWIIVSAAWMIATPIITRNASYDTTYVGDITNHDTTIPPEIVAPNDLALSVYGKECSSPPTTLPAANDDEPLLFEAPTLFRYEVYCTTSSDVAAFWTGILLISLSVPGFLLLLALAFRWIYRGFRPVGQGQA